jgi:hypothetical protein
MQRMCSEKEIGSQFCDKDVLAMLKKAAAETGSQEEKPASENPIWKGLEKLKKNLDK